MTWHRYFCSLCGARTTRPPEPGEYARCAAHAGLPNERDLIPPDPRETIPTMRQELSEVRHADEEARAIRGGGVQGTRAVPPPDTEFAMCPCGALPSGECPSVLGLHCAREQWLAAREREDGQTTRERGT